MRTIGRLFIAIIVFAFATNELQAQKLKDLKQVLPLGNDTYEYTREAGTGFTRQTKLLKKAMLVVEAYADGKDKEYEIIEVYRNEGPFVLGKFPQVKVTFKLKD